MISEKPEKPFKLGTTSFIFPDEIIPNVKKLGPFFDEIEILTFESQPAFVLPSKDDVESLLDLSRRYDINYNIHLPIDVSLTSESHGIRQKAKDTLLKVITLFEPICPTTHTLHLEMPLELTNDMGNLNKLEKWKKSTRQGLESLLRDIGNPGIISIETLDYPFSLIETMVDEFNLSVCIDAGHQIKYDHDLLQTFGNYKSRTSIIHLHGVAFLEDEVKDHTSLDQLPERYLSQVQIMLESFNGVVSLEVFNLENLNRSLNLLSNFFSNIAPQMNQR